MLTNESHDKKNHHVYWERTAGLWERTPSPVRPSTGDCAIYREFLEMAGKKQNILVLGATPELRDIAAQAAGSRVHVADFSRAMLSSMTRLAEHADPDKEIWIEENWLDLALPKNSFDVILGDLILQQIPPPFETRLLEKISSLLAPSGSFIGRFQFLDPAFSPQDAERIIAHELQKPIPDQEKIIPLKLRVLWCSVDLKNRTLDRKLSARLIDEYMREHNIKSPLLEAVKRQLLKAEDAYRKWSPPTEKELSLLLKRHFLVVGKTHANDYEDAHCYPLFILARRDHETMRQRLNFHFELWSRIRFMPRFFVRLWQLRELKKTVRLAYEHVPFYRSLMDSAHVRPDDIGRLQDLGHLPATSKLLFREQASENLLHHSFPLRYVRLTETSGSTGEPFCIPRTSLSLLFKDGRYNIHYWHQALLDQGVSYRAIHNTLRVAHIRTLPEKEPSAVYFFRPIGAVREDPKEVITALKEFHPEVFKAPPTVMIELVRAAERLGLGKLPTPRYLISYGESFDPGQRKIIEDAFGTRVFDHYGLEEVGIIGADCEEHNGIHVNEESYIVEILDDDGNVVEAGTSGRIIVTYFYNYVMPFIRYDTGDRGRLLTDPCQCGRSSPRLSVEGWRGSFLTIAGRKIHSAEFTAVLRSFSKNVLRYQIVKTGPEHLTLRIIPLKQFTAETAQQIKAGFAAQFSFEPELELVDSISFTARGKTMVIVDEAKGH